VKIPTPVARTLALAAIKTKKNSPTILLVAGVVGAVSSTVMACRATLKLNEIIDDASATVNKINAMEDAAYSATDRVHDLRVVRLRTALTIAKIYSPAVGLGVASIGCLVSGHRIMSTRNASIMAAYAALDKGFEEYRARVLQELGPEREKELRYGTEVEKIVGADGKVNHQLKASTSPYARFFDETSSNWQPTPAYNQMFIKCQQDFANDMLNARGHLFLNEVYDALGLPRSREGAVVGWVKRGSGDGYVDFGVFEGDLYKATRFINGDDDAVLLDFNVDGVIYDKI